jgi:hypothetical protein
LVYRKGELTKSDIDKGWPHQVGVIVPGTGLGHLLNEMLAFCQSAGLDHKTRSELRLGPDMMLWCFASAEDPAAFKAHFQERAETVAVPLPTTAARRRRTGR